MVAAVPTCQKHVLRLRSIDQEHIAGVKTGVPTVRVVAIWKTQKAFGLPWASSVRSP